MANVPNMHMMPATVTAVDAKTGIVDVMSEGMSLKVHFPASAVANLKVGDKINVKCHTAKDGSNNCLLGFLTTPNGVPKEFD